MGGGGSFIKTLTILTSAFNEIANPWKCYCISCGERRIQQALVVDF